MNGVPFILFVIPALADKKYVKIVSENYNVKISHTLKSMEEFIFNDDINLIIIDNDLITEHNDKILIRWVSTRKKIPIMILVDSREDALEAIQMKALDFATKPIIPELLLHRIDMTMEHIMEMNVNTKINLTINEQLRAKSKELADLQASIIGVLAEMIEIRDLDASNHDIRTQGYVKLMIRKMIEIPNTYQKEICLWDIPEHILSAQLHDIGKLLVPNEILMKPGPLTDEEYEIVKGHVVMGMNIIDKIIDRVGGNSYLSITKKYIEGHHEWWDGSGYPFQLKGTDISLEGRILSIVDAYDVITNKQPYKDELTHEEAMRRINKDCGTQFDPELIRIFNKAANEFRTLNEGYK